MRLAERGQYLVTGLDKKQRRAVDQLVVRVPAAHALAGVDPHWVGTGILQGCTRMRAE